MVLTNENQGVLLRDFGKINLDITLDCGQAFRWSRDKGIWQGIVRGQEFFISEHNDGLLFHNATPESVREIMLPYLACDTDYQSIISRLECDAVMSSAVSRFGTVRILRQEPWETLCSFIISSCNNIPRIKGIIKNMATLFGSRLPHGHSFPSAERLACLSVEELSVLRAGYRAPFILDAARRVASGEIIFSELERLETAEARQILMTIKGVGKKVADCTLLFGLNHLDAFPVDRHIKRISERLYPDGLPDCFVGIEGVAQQYMFCVARDLQ